MDGCHRAALPYFTGKRYAPSGSSTPTAIPRGVTLVIAEDDPVGQRIFLSIGILHKSSLILCSPRLLVVAGRASTEKRREAVRRRLKANMLGKPAQPTRRILCFIARHTACQTPEVGSENPDSVRLVQLVVPALFFFGHFLFRPLFAARLRPAVF